MWQCALMVYYGFAAYDHHWHNKKLKESVISKPISYLYVLDWKCIRVWGIWEICISRSETMQVYRQSKISKMAVK